MTLQEIDEMAIIEPYCFENEQEEQWYKVGLREGADAAIKQLGWHPASEPPIPDAPYINVVFCKGRNGWIPFTGYGCDISPKKTVEFINCINDAADVLNRKDGEE